MHQLTIILFALGKIYNYFCSKIVEPDRGAQLDPPSLTVHSVGVLIGSPIITLVNSKPT